jgi:hypothetical protein
MGQALPDSWAVPFLACRRRDRGSQRVPRLDHDLVGLPNARDRRASRRANGLPVRLRRGALTVRKLRILIFVLAMPCVAFAQNNQSAWENLSALQAGHKIQVVEMNSKKVSGAFVNVTDAGISLQGPGGEQTIPRQDVRSVKLMENKHRLRNAAIGAAIGAAAGAGALAGLVNSSEGGFNFTAQGAGIGAGAGAVIGAIVGALWPSHQTIYRAAGK